MEDQLPSKFPAIFLDISTETTYLGRVIIKLFDDCPKTCENFRCLATGEKGKSPSGVNLHYKGTTFHRIVEKFFIQGGDITKAEHHEGTGGESIYGKHFPDENFNHKHDRPFLVAMANLGEKDTNSSQFYITSKKTPWLDDTHVVFGECIKGKQTVWTIQRLGNKEGRPRQKTIITDCGQIDGDAEMEIKKHASNRGKAHYNYKAGLNAGIIPLGEQIKEHRQ